MYFMQCLGNIYLFLLQVFYCLRKETLYTVDKFLQENMKSDQRVFGKYMVSFLFKEIHVARLHGCQWNE